MSLSSLWLVLSLINAEVLRRGGQVNEKHVEPEQLRHPRQPGRTDVSSNSTQEKPLLLTATGLSAPSMHCQRAVCSHAGLSSSDLNE